MFKYENVLNNAGYELSQLSFSCNMNSSVRQWNKLQKIERSRRNWEYFILKENTKIHKAIRISPRRTRHTIPSNTPSDIPKSPLKSPSNTNAQKPPHTPNDIPSRLNLNITPSDTPKHHSGHGSSNSSETLTSQLTLDAIANMKKRTYLWLSICFLVD